jgi:hypothetical protein
VAGVTEAGLSNEHECERARENEEEGRVQALVGNGADLDPPRARA